MRHNFYQGVLTSGYLVTNEAFYRVWNLTLLTPVLVFSIPVIFLLCLILPFTQGFPIFYKGVRLGKDKKTFIIYKFRTLRVDAEIHLKERVLPTRSGLETPLGKFLRESRLDELPQLFNILKGNMNFMGPRPVRSEIAKLSGLMIKDYDIRFTVKPGLAGYTQLFTTHRTPKRIRAKFNSYFCRHRAFFWKEPFILALTVAGILRKICFFVRIRLLPLIKIGRLTTRRLEPRLRPSKAEVILTGNSKLIDFSSMSKKKATVTAIKDEKLIISCLFLDINDEVFSFLSPVSLSKDQNRFLLKIDTSCPKKKVRACCIGNLIERDMSIIGSRIEDLKIRDCMPEHLYLAYYTPVSDFDYYKIDKYFLENSILR